MIVYVIINLLLNIGFPFGDHHRKHKIGIVFQTYPCVYSCFYCHKEVRPYDLLPKNYLEMKINPTVIGKDTFYWNGYPRFSDSLKINHINEDSFFMAEWNKVDTSCISSELAVNKSDDFWHNWLNTHKKGKYYLSQSDWMSTDGFVGSNGKDGGMAYAMGGRFSDEVLLADKWYKIVYYKTKKHRSLFDHF